MSISFNSIKFILVCVPLCYLDLSQGKMFLWVPPRYSDLSLANFLWKYLFAILSEKVVTEMKTSYEQRCGQKPTQVQMNKFRLYTRWSLFNSILKLLPRWKVVAKDFSKRVLWDPLSSQRCPTIQWTRVGHSDSQLFE